MPRRLFSFALCAVLSACAVQPAGPGRETAPVDDQSMAEPPQPDPAIPAPPPQRAAIAPASLVGMTGARITSLFGTPVFVRRDPPGEFWRYRNRTCVLELFFYLRDGAQRVDHIETRNTGKNPQDRSNCIEKLRKPPTRS